MNPEYKSWNKRSAEKVRRERGSKIESWRAEGIQAPENRINDKRMTKELGLLSIIIFK